MHRIAIPFAAICALSGTALAEEQQDGQLLFNNACRTCHTTDEGDNRLGPNLHGIVGRKAGSLEGFAYSSSLANADFEWTKDNLDRFLTDPQAMAPGNNMKPFAGLADEKDRAAIIAFLENQDS